MKTAKEKKQRTPAERKRRMAAAIIVVCLLGAGSWLLLQHPEWLERTPKKQSATSMYSDRILSYTFYPSDYGADLSKDAEYLELDRYLHLQRGAENFAVTDGDYAAWGEDVEFFSRYFDAAVAGDAERYNSLFTDAYYRTHEPYERFAPQRIYNITLEKRSETESTWVYDVTYAIHRNDGSFRNDIDSDAAKTLIFTLVREGGTVRIENIDYYRVAR